MYGLIECCLTADRGKACSACWHQGYAGQAEHALPSCYDLSTGLGLPPLMGLVGQAIQKRCSKGRPPKTWIQSAKPRLDVMITTPVRTVRPHLEEQLGPFFGEGDLSQTTSLPGLPRPDFTTAKYKANAESAAILLANACSISEAAARIGITRNTLYEWMNTAHFQALYELKKAERRLMLEGMILEAAEG